MEFENLIRISSMVNSIYTNIQESSSENSEIIENDSLISKQIDKWEDNLKSIVTIFDE